MMHFTFILRQLLRSKRQALVFVLCLALSITSIVALAGLNESAEGALAQDARELMGGDLMVHGHRPFSANLTNALDQIPYERAHVYEFLSIVRTENDSLLSNLKVVEKGYPFYGEVEIASGRSFATTLTSRTAIVEQALLDRLGVNIGENVSVGNITVTIVDVVTHEPDRPVEFFSLGPRVFLSAEDKEDLGLFLEGSRIDYNMLLKITEDEIDETEEFLQAQTGPRESIRSYENAENRVLRYLDNLTFFLNMLAIFILLLAGFAMHGTLSAYLKEREGSVAIMRTLGARGKYVLTQFLCVVLVLGVIGTLIGIIAGILLQFYLPSLFTGLLPEGFENTISLWGIAQGVILGIFMILLFAFLPLYRLRETRPIAIFREDISHKRSYKEYVALALIAIFFIGFILLQLDDTRFALTFIGGIAVLVLIAAALSEIILKGLQKIVPESLALRQAIRGLFRPKNATRIIIITLGASLAFLFSILLLESNLNRSFVETYPPGSPNLYAIDIQPGQVGEFKEIMPQGTEIYPIVTARITHINDDEINRDQESERWGDNLGREFRLTYRNDLIMNERLTAGEALFSDVESVPVSIHQDIVEMANIGIGDTISFNIQGVPLTAEVTSIRDSEEGTMSPFFYFVFEPEILKDAPQTVFGATYTEQPTQLQNTIAQSFPTVTTINVSEVIATLSTLLGQLTRIIEFFTLFALLAGILIIISSVLATQYERTQEAVYYKVLGAKRVFVLKVFILENLIIGLVSALIGLGIAQVTVLYTTREIFALEYLPFWRESLLLVGATILVTMTVSLLMSRNILRKKPIAFLREHTEE